MEPIQPLALPVTRTELWKSVNGTRLMVDIYETPRPTPRTTYVIYIHGGSYVGGNRGDYCRPMFARFLAEGYNVASFEHRLAGEVDMSVILKEDISDMEPWIYQNLTKKELILCACSAGTHFTQYAAKFWNRRICGIVFLSMILDLDRTEYHAEHRHSKKPAAKMSIAELIDRAIEPSSKPALARVDPLARNYKERIELGRQVLVKGPGPFLARGFRVAENGERAFYGRGEVSSDEIDPINPLRWAKSRDRPRYPPTLIIDGGKDDIFLPGEHGDILETILKTQGTPVCHITVPDGDHAWEMFAHSGDRRDLEYIQKGMGWLLDVIQE